MLNELEDILYRKGLYYKNKFKRTKEEGLHIAVVDWERLRKGQSLNYAQLERIYGYMTDSHTDKLKLKSMTKESI